MPRDLIQPRCSSRRSNARPAAVSLPPDIIRERRGRQLYPGFHPHSARPLPAERLKETITIRTPLRFSPKLRPRRLRPWRIPNRASGGMANPEDGCDLQGRVARPMEPGSGLPSTMPSRRRWQQPGKMHARPIRTLGTPPAWPILRTKHFRSQEATLRETAPWPSCRGSLCGFWRGHAQGRLMSLTEEERRAHGTGQSP